MEEDDEEEILETVEEIEAYKKKLQADLQAKEREHEELQERGQFKKADALCNKIFDLYNEVRAVDAFLVKKQRENQVTSSQHALFEIKGTGLVILDKMLTEFMQNFSNGYYGLPSAEDVHNMLATLRQSSAEPGLEEIIKDKGGEKNFVRDTIELMLQLKKDNFTISMVADNLCREFGMSGEPLEPPIVLPPIRESQNPSVAAIKKAAQNAFAQDQSYLIEEDLKDTEDVTLLENEDDEENDSDFLEIDQGEADYDNYIDELETVVRPAEDELELTIVEEDSCSKEGEASVEELDRALEIDDIHVTLRRQKMSQFLQECDSTISDLEGDDDDCDDSFDMMIVSQKIVAKLRQEFCQRKPGITVYGLPRKVKDQQKNVEVVDLSNFSQECTNTHSINVLSVVDDSRDNDVEVTFSRIDSSE